MEHSESDTFKVLTLLSSAESDHEVSADTAHHGPGGEHIATTILNVTSSAR